MRRQLRYLVIFIFLTMVLSYPCFASGAGGEEMSKEDIKKPPSEGLKIVEKMKFRKIEFNVPKVGREIERVELPNGMILYLREDHRFPVIDIYGVIRTGAAYEKKSRYGVANLTGTVMRTGGTRNLSPDQLNEDLEQIAATLESCIEEEEGTIHLNVITSQKEKGMNLFAEVLRYPAFAEKEMELAKSEIKESLRRRNDNYRTIGEREFYKIVFPDYCHGWEYDWEVVKKIKRDDLIAWHKRFYHPNNMMFAIVGDFKKQEMIDKFNQLFGDWKKSRVDLSGLQTFEKKFFPGVFFVKKDVDQSYIRMGHLGVKRDNPDCYAIRIMDYILGNGGFNSWMTEKIRSDEGLAYAVYSYFNTISRNYGTCGAVCSTKSDSTVKAAKLMIEQINRIRSEMVPDDKLKWAKDSIINSFLFEFDDPFDQTLKLMTLEYQNISPDYYEKFCENIRKVTAQDVNRVAKEYLEPSKLTIIVVGNVEKFDQPLSALGKPKEIPLLEVIKD